MSISPTNSQGFFFRRKDVSLTREETIAVSVKEDFDTLINLCKKSETLSVLNKVAKEIVEKRESTTFQWDDDFDTYLEQLAKKLQAKGFTFNNNNNEELIESVPKFSSPPSSFISPPVPKVKILPPIDWALSLSTFELMEKQPKPKLSAHEKAREVALTHLPDLYTEQLSKPESQQVATKLFPKARALLVGGGSFFNATLSKEVMEIAEKYGITVITPSKQNLQKAEKGDHFYRPRWFKPVSEDLLTFGHKTITGDILPTWVQDFLEFSGEGAIIPYKKAPRYSLSDVHPAYNDVVVNDVGQQIVYKGYESGFNLADAMGIPSRFALTANEGGNVLKCSIAKKPAIVVGRSSILSTLELFKEENFVIDGEKFNQLIPDQQMAYVKMAFAYDYGVDVSQVVIVEQPAAFHVDMGMFPIDDGVMALNDPVKSLKDYLIQCEGWTSETFDQLVNGLRAQDKAIELIKKFLEGLKDDTTVFNINDLNPVIQKFTLELGEQAKFAVEAVQSAITAYLKENNILLNALTRGNLKNALEEDALKGVFQKIITEKITSSNKNSDIPDASDYLETAFKKARLLDVCGEQLKTAGFEVVRVAGAQRHINTLNMIQFTTSDGQRVAIIPKSDTSEQKSPSHDVREALEERGVIVEEVSFDVGFCILCAGGGLSCASKAIV